MPMSDDLPEEQPRPNPPEPKSKVVAIIGVIAGLVFVVATGLVIYLYSWSLIPKSFKASWGFVVKESPWAWMLGAVIWFLGAWREYGKQWRRAVMTHIKKWIISLWAPTAAFGLVMLLHLFIWTPGQMYQDKLKESGLLTNQVATLTKANAGFESRFGQLREQLAEEQKITKHQAATISSLQAQLSQSASKLADIDAQRDKSAAAVLRRSTNLCSQLSAFLAERNRGEQSIDAGVVFSRGANGQMQASKGGKMISEAEAHELRDAAWKARGAFDYETDVKFVNQFAARLMALRDDFAGIGIVSESFNQTLGSSFRMDWGRREILMEINKMAAQVRD